MTLAEFRDLFPSKGAILGAFSRMIDRQVLEGTSDDLAGEPARERLFDVFMRRIDALTPYKAALRRIAGGAAARSAVALRLEPGGAELAALHAGGGGHRQRRPARRAQAARRRRHLRPHAATCGSTTTIRASPARWPISTGPCAAASAAWSGPTTCTASPRRSGPLPACCARGRAACAGACANGRASRDDDGEDYVPAI